MKFGFLPNAHSTRREPHAAKERVTAKHVSKRQRAEDIRERQHNSLADGKAKINLTQAK